LPPFTPQLGLFDEQVVRSAKLRNITDWPEQQRFPLNFTRNKVEDIVLNDIRASTSPLIITGFTSLDYLIDFVADLNAGQPQSISILFGSEPSPARRKEYSLKKSNFPQEVIDYWLEAGISLRLCYKILKFKEMIENGRIVSRYIPDEKNKLHAKIFLAESAATLGSSNFSFTGFRRQLEANVRFDAQKEPKRYREAEQIAKNYWDLGEDYNQELLNLLQQLLQVVSWEEALGRACGELLEGEWAQRYIKNRYVSSGNELWPSQKTGIAQALWMVENVGSVLVADATGSGKTRMGAHLLRSVMDRIWSTGRVRKDITALVCPPNFVKEAWKKEAVECGLPLSVLSHGILSYEKSEKHEEILKTVRRAQSLAVDEAHNFLNPTSSRTRSLLGNMADVMVMFTATPINKGVLDLLRIVDLLGADNLDDDSLRLFERLEQRIRRSRGQLVATKAERQEMQKAVQRFTLRRTKTMFNTMVDQQPEAYCDDRGKQCRYPEHTPKTYETKESVLDQRNAEKIRKLAGDLKGLINLQSAIERPEGLNVDDDRFIKGRLHGSKGLAIYQLMSRLRSSRAAVVEHLLGTTEAARRFHLEVRIKTEDTGNVLKTLEEFSGQVKPSSLAEKLPIWLTDPDEHQKAVSEELDIYKRILELIDKISDNREQNKAKQLSELLKRHRLLLAFDSCLISLEIIKQLIHQQNTGCKVIVATGSQIKSKKEVNKLFALGSNAEGVIALCSDAMSEGLNLQQASAVVLLDMPSVIRVAEQRVGRVDRMNSPHKAIEVWWPIDSDAFALKTDRKFFRRYTEVRDILGSNLDLPENLIPEEIAEGPDTVEEMVSKLAELDQKGTSWDGIQDAFQPVRDLVGPECGIVPVEVYNQVKHSKARVLSSVSLVKAKRAWAFFAILGADHGAPKWIFFDHPTAHPLTHLEEIASRLREVLSGDIENRTMDAKASLLIEKFLEHVLATKQFLLPRKKQRALTEMKLVLEHYIKNAKNQDNWGEVELLNDILKFTDKPKNDEERPDLDTIAEIWLDLTRDAWYEKLLKKRRYKPLRLKDIRKDLQQNPLDVEQLREAFSNIRQSQPINSRVISAIIGVA